MLSYADNLAAQWFMVESLTAPGSTWTPDARAERNWRRLVRDIEDHGFTVEGIARLANARTVPMF